MIRLVMDDLETDAGCVVQDGEPAPLWDFDQTYLLGAFAKLRKATISFIVSARPHVTIQLPLDRFSLNLIFEDFSKFCRENSRWIKIRKKTTGTFHEDLCAFMIISRWILLRMRIVSDKSCRETPNTHFIFIFF